MPSLKITNFHVSIAEIELSDLKRRLQCTRWPEKETVEDWSQGAPLDEIKHVCQYWQDKYDWRRCERWLNQIGSYMTEIDGLKIHFLHIRSRYENALPLLMLHGWPGSIIEFRKVIGPLTDPSAYGGDTEDSFHLVLPTMPGYGFSQKPVTTGMNHRRMGELYSHLMEGLGYKSWVAQGGDWGADICAKMASQNPPLSLRAIHLSTLFFDARKEIGSDPSDEEKLAMEKQIRFEADEYGYFKQQATRPQTLGYLLADSPVGQAAWIYEKLYSWSQHEGKLEDVLSIDEILDNIMLYWLTNTGASSARLYWEDDDNTALPISIPVGVTVFPGEMTCGPRHWGERYYSQIIHWRDARQGGHFAAWEVPGIFVKEMQDCFKHLRP